MTEVKLLDTGATKELRATGHAEGYPDVCAAISTLVTTFAGWVQNLEAPNSMHIADGDSSVAVVLAGENPVWEFLKIGFLQLERSYPQALRVSVQEHKGRR